MKYSGFISRLPQLLASFASLMKAAFLGCLCFKFKLMKMGLKEEAFCFALDEVQVQHRFRFKFYFKFLLVMIIAPEKRMKLAGLLVNARRPWENIKKWVYEHLNSPVFDGSRARVPPPGPVGNGSKHPRSAR